VPKEETQFKPGETGNPNGRPKKLKFYEIVDKILDLPIKELPPALREPAMELAGDENKTARQAGAARVVKEIFTGNPSFLKDAMDRIEGPVTQRTETKAEYELGPNTRHELTPLLEAVIAIGSKTPVAGNLPGETEVVSSGLIGPDD